MSQQKKSVKQPKQAEAEVTIHKRSPSLPAVICLLLALVTLAVYWRTTSFNFINYDDHDYITENYRVLGGLTWHGAKWAFITGHTGNWHPLTWFSHMLDAQLFGGRAGGHHFTNVLLHIANSILTFLLLRQLTGAQWRSAIVAAFFALHPLHVESVAWVSERKDVLSVFFGLLALWCYAQYVEASKSHTPKKKIQYGLTLSFFALGLMSKPMLVTLPFVLLLLDYWPLKRFPVDSKKDWRPALWRLTWEKLPFFALSTASCVVTFLVQREGGAVQSLTNFPLSFRVQNAFVTYARYLGKTFWPADLANPYPYPEQWPVSRVLFSAVLVVGLCIAALLLTRTRPYAFTGWFWFWGALIPVIGIVQVGIQSMADRYTYLPLTGLFIVVVWGVAEFTIGKPVLKLVSGAVTACMIVACAWRTVDQLKYWHDSGALAQQALAVTGDNDVALTNLANHQLETGLVDDAIENYNKALRTISARGGSNMDIVAVLTADDNATANEQRRLLNLDLRKSAACAEILNNLGTALARKGQVDEAILHYRAAIQLKPNHALALHNLAFELSARKQYDRAIALLEVAVRSKPDAPEIRNSLANALRESGRLGEAIAQYNEALRRAPTHAETHNNLGLALAAQGKQTQAIQHYEAALKSDSGLIEVHNNLGSALLKIGQVDEAIKQFRLLLQMMPEHARAHDNLGIALATKGQLDDAVAEIHEALRYDPDNANTHFNLGNVLALQGNFEEAARQYAETLRLKPDHAQAHCHLGGLLIELGRREEAFKHLKEALDLQPDYAEAKAQLRVLGEVSN